LLLEIDFRKLQFRPAAFSKKLWGFYSEVIIMPDSMLLPPVETVAVEVLPIYQSQLDRVAALISGHYWLQEQVSDYGLNASPRVLQQSLRNVISTHLEAMLTSWTAEDWLRGDLGTELQAEIKRLGNR
jgi:hypothetical protein